MLQTCFVDQACDFMYQCDNGACKHQEVFPLQIYPTLVYFLIPIACGLCNLTGNSMGMFKIMILMNLLRYEIGQATAIIQAIVIGAALPNFINLILSKHPKGKTSLINFNIVLIFIPCCLYGSTLGSLLESILPQMIQDILILLMFTFFSLSFIQKIRKEYKLKNYQQRQSLMTSEQTRQSFNIQQDLMKSNQNTQIQQSKEKIIQQSENQAQIQQIEHSNQKSESDKVSENKILTQSNNLKNEIKQQEENNSLKKIKKKIKKNLALKKLKNDIKKYQLSIHLKDIIQSFAVFIVFQLIAFLVQGKLPFLSFNKCTIQYPLGMLLLTAVTILYVFFVKNQMIEKFQNYKLVKFKTDINLGNNKIFWRLVLGAFGAGFVQGTLGVGAGTFLMVVMLSLSIDPRVAAATSGYQILFTGSGALTEQFINDKITVENALFFFVWTAVSGGIVTYFMYKGIKRMNQNKVKRILLIVIAVLCTLSLALIFPVSIQRIIEEGWSYMFQAHFQC